MAKKNGEESEAKPRRQRQKGGFAVYKEVSIDSDTGDKIVTLTPLVSGLASVIDAEKAIRERGSALADCSLVIVQVKREITVKVEQVTKVSF